MRYLSVVLVVLSWLSAADASAGDACKDAVFIHNYPVLDADAYANLFEAVEGYCVGPKGESPWPFAEHSTTKYSTRDFCPASPEDRLVRLFEVPDAAVKESAFQAGTLTLVTRDMTAAQEAVARLAMDGLRHSMFKGRKSFHFTDAAGNEFYVWEYPGPPD